MNCEQLKQKVLSLAISGRLVEQDSNDEPASELLKRIAKEKQQLIKNGKIKKEKPLTPISPDEIPFDIPSSWQWVRLGELGVYKKGPFGSSLTKSMFVPKSNNSIKVYEQKNAIQKQYNIGTYYITKEKFEKMRNFETHCGDIIVSCAGTIGETYVLPKEAPIGIINQALMKVSLYNKDITPFWLIYFKTILKKDLSEKGKGSAIINIPPFSILKNLLFPLPPLKEQERIVEKVNMIFEEIEAIEKSKEQYNSDAKLLLQKVLSLAISGRLVEQDSNDEPASELLKRIAKEKQQLIKNGKIKLSKPEKLVGNKIISHFDIPNTWVWCKLNDICRVFGRIGYRGYTTADLRNNKEEGAISLSPSNMVNGKMDYMQCTCISIEKYNESPEIQINNNDILIVKTGSSFGKVAKVTDLPWKATINPQIAVIKNIQINTDYLTYFLQSPFTQANFEQFVSGTAIPTFSQLNLISLDFPLPPLKEQERIVEKIEKIMPLVKELEL